VRFATEVAGVEEIGATGRGESMEIGTYVGNAITSEMSGNMIDLCPVGALTSKPFAFTARSWELRRTESIDVLDAVGSAIGVDARGAEVMRILPRLNEDINEEWLADKSRFAYDGLKRQRLDQPYVRDGGKLREATWEEAFGRIKDALSDLDGSAIGAIAGDLADVEAMCALKDLMAALGSANIDCRQDGAKLEAGARASYIFNSSIAGIEDADAILLIGTNPRTEAPVLNARIRKRWLAGGCKIGVIGPQMDLTYRTTHVGTGPQALADLGAFAEVLEAAERPMIVLGAGAVARADGAAVLAAARALAQKVGAVGEGWNGFNLLQRAASRVGGLDIDFMPGNGGLDTAGILAKAQVGTVKAVWLLGADEIDMNQLGDAFVVYQGHHGDAGAHRADVILPGAAYTEKNATYVNTEGRVQRTKAAHFPLGEAKEDWAVIRAYSAVAGHQLPYDSLEAVRARMNEINPVFGTVDVLAETSWVDFGAAGEMSDAPFAEVVDNYYMTDPISRASITMARCTEGLLPSKKKATGTHG
jgi:NADH-quinone oxidoreductase subunit G